MLEGRASISVPPSTRSRIEGQYKPQNPGLFAFYLKYRELRKDFSKRTSLMIDNSEMKKGLAFDATYQTSMVEAILDKMPVWNETERSFKVECFLLLLDFFRCEPHLTEEYVIEQILVLREAYEHRNGLYVEVTAENEVIADIYRKVVFALTRLCDPIDSVSDTPTKRDLQTI